MLFNKEEYYKSIKQKEIINGILYIILLATAGITGYILNSNFKIIPAISYIIPIIIAIFIDYIFYVKLQIQLEEMKMKIDIYNKIMKDKREE